MLTVACVYSMVVIMKIFEIRSEAMPEFPIVDLEPTLVHVITDVGDVSGT